MQIVTARLRLDAMVDVDVQAFFEYRADPRVSRYQGWSPASMEEAACFISAHRGIEPGAVGQWWQHAIRLRETGELIGDIGVHGVDDATVELGISLAPVHQRHGYAREALEVVLDFVFGGLHKQRAMALVDPDNFMCMRLLEGLGMRRGADRDGDAVFTLEAGDWLAPADVPDDR